MKTKPFYARTLVWVLSIFLAMPPGAFAQQSGEKAPFKAEELDQLLAPIALYPDPLISQVLMASTYPLEIVLADRFAQQNKDLKGDALTKALEAQSWDPSVKSLVNFPQVLKMMSEELEWTLKLGDAFLEQQENVMDSIQKLRAEADAAGYLKSNQEQKVITEENIITIEPANPQVIYVPAYEPTVVYGVWPYPAYPPYYYYPPGYVWWSPFWFAAGVGLGPAWGYAWGSCNWHRRHVWYNYHQNININNNINRNRYAWQLPPGGQGSWQHNPEHRQGVSYRDQGTAQKFNRASTSAAIKSREAFRGRAEQGRLELGRGGAAGQGGLGGRGVGFGGLGGAGFRGGAGQLGGGGVGVGSRGGAFQGINGGGSAAGSASQRGGASRGSFGGGGSRPSGGFGGGGLGGGGGGGRRR